MGVCWYVVTPEPGQWFALQGKRGQRWRCIEVRPHDVLAFGGSMQPWGHKATRSFPLDAPFVIVKVPSAG
jgi:hypothetical protein